MTKHTKKQRLISVLLGAFSIFLVAYIILSIASPSTVMDVFRFRTFIIVSPSMEPVLNVNDMILITETSEDDLEEGDIITFLAYIPELRDYSYVTHYVASIDTMNNTTIYKTKGARGTEDDYDTWTDPDGNIVDITFDDIEGEYRFTIPLAGQLVYRLQDPIFVGLLFINGTIIYFLYKTVHNYLESKKEDEKKEID